MLTRPRLVSFAAGLGLRMTGGLGFGEEINERFRWFGAGLGLLELLRFSVGT